MNCSSTSEATLIQFRSTRFYRCVVNFGLSRSIRGFLSAWEAVRSTLKHNFRLHNLKTIRWMEIAKAWDWGWGWRLAARLKYASPTSMILLNSSVEWTKECTCLMQEGTIHVAYQATNTVTCWRAVCHDFWQNASRLFPTAAFVSATLNYFYWDFAYLSLMYSNVFRYAQWSESTTSWHLDLHNDYQVDRRGFPYREVSGTITMQLTDRKHPAGQGRTPAVWSIHKPVQS